MMSRKVAQAGFTLLEVMIAMMIMSVALGAILTSQSGGIIQATKSKEINIAGWLAHKVMVESEHLYEGKPFSELEKEKKERFLAPFEKFTWKREVRELEFPDFTQPGKEGESIAEPVRILGKVMTKYLNTSMREMVITITWQRGTTEQSLTLTTYLVDLNAEFNFAI